ncbi:MAG: tRNA (adenosine(37)-N6)-dimethylallyltransferase MiaA [Sulfurospirillaceae bacterium]|nr:tRNA (adenosine(37)-N6)-dimethylallyltransferase MiaA [Sulfurospirillaceae bacterium]
MKCIAILGASASGKTALSIEVAKNFNAYILSLDSLSLYKEINIASAKPTLEERCGIVHFGIDEFCVTVDFNVTMFFDLYKKAKKACEKDNKNLIIVGGTGFYLKAMMEGLSTKPPINEVVAKDVANALKNLKKAYETIENIDPVYASKISSNDPYRIEKWLEIFYATKQIPSQYMLDNKNSPIISHVTLFEIETDKEILRQRIAKRTDMMLQKGLIDEVIYLEKTFTRTPNCMKSIGIAEVLEYLDGYLSKDELREKIITNTARLAKRQRTFNTTQFPPHTKESIDELKILIENHLHSPLI